MKTTICCHYLEINGEFPCRNIFPKGRKGHDLIWLLAYITEKCFKNDYVLKVSAAKTDINFLRNDSQLKDIIKILSDFGQAARYYNLNVVHGEDDPGPSPDAEWQRLEMYILKQDPEWVEKLSDISQSSCVHLQVNRELTIHCEKLARALSRLFIIGGLGEQAKQMTPYIQHFLRLTDQQLGKTNYNTIKI